MDIEFLFVIVALILSIIIHEVSHGYMANYLGDPTARLAGRLTLNPVPHIDPLGSVIIPALLVISGAGFLFGWAKPVPYNPYNLNNQKWGDTLVAAAGPLSNIALAIIFAFLVRFGIQAGFDSSFVGLAHTIVYINVLLALFNLIPIPPLDGSKILAGLLPLQARMSYEQFSRTMEQYGLLAMFVFIFIFITLFGSIFFGFVKSVVRLLTGL